MRRKSNNQKGFTLIEIIAVLILLGILAAVALPRYMSLTANAELRAIDAAVAELNGRENMTWANEMLSNAGWQNDATTWAAMDTTFDGADYSWFVAPTAAGGTIQFRGNTTQALTRNASTATTPAYWTNP